MNSNYNHSSMPQHNSKRSEPVSQKARDIRSRWAQETLDIVKNGQYRTPAGQWVDIREQIDYTLSSSKMYRPAELPAVQQQVEQQIRQRITEGTQKAEMECTGESTLQAAERLIVQEKKTKVLALNFASARNPGGGFLGGSQAQEESLARSSSLYPAIVQMEEMYAHNRRERSCLYSDYMIYSPSVTVFREDDGQLREEPYQVSMMTVPAVNAGVVREREPDRISQIEPVMKQRIRYLLSVAAMQGERSLVLGAFGCGVFRNDPHEVAQWFHDILQKEQYGFLFEKIVFAVLDKSKTGNAAQPFRALFASE